MFHGISIVVQGSTVSRSSDKSFLMSLSLVYGTKMSMLDLYSKRVFVQVCKAKMKNFAFDRYARIQEVFGSS